MGVPFTTVKREVVASRAVVAANQPLATAAGLEMLAAGGNAVDAAVATLAALTTVEPMMVSIFGAGFFLHRTPAGEIVALDNYATVPAAALPHNAASIRVLQKNGFRHEGLAERYLLIAGRWQDHAIFAITAEEWEARPAQRREEE